ncbi:hypothetical protein BJF89_16365 [Corynebacterium sp. CNJ-954]|uniref:fumarylacetoacetate hydrolase family protein n=1 Tax=Corynebacterium sp. CNJ-954 TaxID=1904962 RepID=UPI00095F2506|nr:fumarylacetoacetate hydrolase family protein [Corynebacterium sp. CNJ-954]OLT54611.1 hypothetical protein BJF89_16365 [Corynebacterium sp. CNJ-954]
MQYAQYIHDGHRGCAIHEDGVLYPTDWDLRDLMVLAAAGANPRIEKNEKQAVDVADVTLLAPLARGSRIICAGINYLAHQQESADTFSANVPEDPIIFIKDQTAICGPEDTLVLSEDVSTNFDWEAELGVVIGATAQNITRNDAWDVVAGYTVVNDISARDIQTKHQQWTLGKNVDRSTPIGPWISTYEEVGPDPDLAMTLKVNGVEKQSTRTGDMIFDIPKLIETVSHIMTLYPGDIIATGTPSGVGFKRTPPEFLHDGDKVTTIIKGIGQIENKVRTH